MKAWLNAQRLFWIKIQKLLGALLVVIGLASLIYSAVFYFNTPAEEGDTRGMVLYGILSLVFIIPGIGLILTTRSKLKS